MNMFLSLCALSGILMAISATVHADVNEDLGKLRKYMDTIRSKQEEIRRFVQSGQESCFERSNSRSSCQSGADLVERAIYQPYVEALIFIKEYMDELTAKPEGFKRLKPKKVMQQAMNNVMKAMETGLRDVRLRDNSASNLHKIGSEIFPYWNLNKILQFQKDANKLHNKYSSWPLIR